MHSYGLIAERSVRTIAGLLGILKSGAAYLPLDPSQPAARLQALCAGAGVRTLVSPGGLISGGRLHGTSCDVAEPERFIGPRLCDLYVWKFGRPKAVAIEHHSAANLIMALERRIYDHGGPLRVALNAPLTFDASVKQWTRLLRGDTLLLVPEEVRYDPRAMLSWLARRRVEVLDCTPLNSRRWSMPASSMHNLPT